MSKWKWTTETTSFDATDTGRVFDRLIREFGNPKEINRICAETALEAMQIAFDRAVDPGTARPWPPLAENTVAAKGSAIPLVRKGRLRESFQRGRPGNVFLVNSKRAKVGSRLKTAVLAQFGTKPHKIRARRKPMLVFKTAGGLAFAKSVNHPGTPPRPVVGISPGTMGEMNRRIGLYLDQIQREAGARG
jgi:phage gpG-like protein